MARKIKKSLEYFTLDVTFSDSIRLASKEIKGGHGLSLIIELWQKIYGSHGYYMNFDKDSRILFLDYSITKIELDELDRCLQVLFNRKIFDKTMFEKFSILTSDSIQERYIDICTSAKRLNIELIQEFICVDQSQYDLSKFNIRNLIRNNIEEVHSQCNKSGINDTDSVINPEFGTQSKVKQSKEEYSKVNNETLQNDTFSELQNTCKNKIEIYEETFLTEDLQNFIDLFKNTNVTEQEIKTAMYDFKLNKMTCDKPQPPYNYKTYKEWFKKYLTDNRQKYKHELTFRVVSISDKATREDLHSAFKFYWQNEYTIDFIRERILSGEYPPKKETVHFDNLIKNKLIEVTND